MQAPVSLKNAEWKRRGVEEILLLQCTMQSSHPATTAATTGRDKHAYGTESGASSRER